MRRNCDDRTVRRVPGAEASGTAPQFVWQAPGGSEVPGGSKVPGDNEAAPRLTIPLLVCIIRTIKSLGLECGRQAPQGRLPTGGTTGE